MKILLVICVVLYAVAANPIPGTQESIDMLRIPLEGDKELDVLTVGEGSSQLNERNKRTIGMLRELFPQLSRVNAEEAESLMEAEDINAELTRVARETEKDSENAIEEKSIEEESDQQTAESQAASAQQSSAAVDELNLDDDELVDNEDRNKRFLNFGFGASSGNSNSGSSGGSGGGSANFLFDIIRRTADRAARAAGTVYRVVAGTETLGGLNVAVSTRTTNSKSGDSNTSNVTTNGRNFVLIGGGSGTEQTDEKANAPDNDSAPKADGYTEGIPGPVTRLFVLANRGLSNLIQDLILRIAQTSERVVNFKARLITSLI